MKRSELRSLLALALPLVAAQLGQHMMSLVDAILVGRLGPEAQAGVCNGNGIYFAFTLLGFGAVMGCEPLISQAIGAGQSDRARAVRRAALQVALLVALPMTLIIGLSPTVLPRLGIAPDITEETRRYLFGRLPGVLPFLLFAGERAYLQSLGRTRPIIVSVVLANLINFIGNLLLIYGDRALVRVGLGAHGLPALGVLGAGLASSLSTWLSFLVLSRAIAALKMASTKHSLSQLRQQIVEIGLPIGLQLFAEIGLFAAAGLLASHISAVAGGAHQTAIALASCTFIVAVGLGAATSTRVGLHVGAGDSEAARRAGFTGLALVTGFMACCGVLFVAVPHTLGSLVTNSAEVLASAEPLIVIAAFFQISDGLQAVAAGALRGAGDTRASFVANVVGHYGVGLPVALWLGLHRHMGIVGLWWGLLCGLTAVALFLVVRFVVLSSRPMKPVQAAPAEDPPVFQ